MQEHIETITAQAVAMVEHLMRFKLRCAPNYERAALHLMWLGNSAQEHIRVFGDLSLASVDYFNWSIGCEFKAKDDSEEMFALIANHPVDGVLPNN